MDSEQLNTIRRFFGLDEHGEEIEPHKPINRLAYTQEDIEYKLEVIKEMQKLGMTIYIDKIGNVCGEIKKDSKSDKTFMTIVSHTDSVSNGGRYDGPLGVVSGLLAIKDFSLKNKDTDKNLKVVICAAEESSRFGLSCIGSRYLANKLQDNDFKRKDSKGVILEDAVNQFINQMKSVIPEIQIVDRVLREDEVENVLESHIEQSDYLAESGMDGATVDGVASALRFKLIAKEGTPSQMEYSLDLWGILMNIMAYKENAGFRICSPEVISNEDSNNLESNLNKIAPKSQTLFEVPLGENNHPILENINILIPFVEQITGTIIELSPIEKGENEAEQKVFHLEISGEEGHSGAVNMADRRDAVFGKELLNVLLNISLNNPEILNTIQEFIKTSSNQLLRTNENLYDILSNIMKMNTNNNLKFDPSINKVSILGVESGLKVKSKENFYTTFTNTTITNISKNIDARITFPTSSEKMKDSVTDMISLVQDITGIRLEYEEISRGEPIQLSGLGGNISQAAQELGLSWKNTDSYPGHDIQYISQIAQKSGMIWLPSINGSHSPKEYMKEESIVHAINMQSRILEYLLERDRRESRDCSR